MCRGAAFFARKAAFALRIHLQLEQGEGRGGHRANGDGQGNLSSTALSRKQSARLQRADEG